MPEALTEPPSSHHIHNQHHSSSSVYSSYGSQFDSPDNDSAFSSESGGGGSGGGPIISLTGGAPPSSSQEQQLLLHSPSSTSYQQDDVVSSSSSSCSRTGGPRRTLYVKIFCGDGSTKSVMINESMSIAYVLSVLVEKNHVQPDPSWGIVEQIPDLYLERCYEDHECLVANLLEWRQDSPNKILFLSRPEKYDLFRRPERYLVSSPTYGSEPSQVKTSCTGGREFLGSGGGGSSGGGAAPIGSSLNTTWDQLSRQNLLQEFFSRSGEDYYPEIEGMLWLKTEGKKSWKKNYFALRADGIYQRGGKLLASLVDHQVYRGIGWKKKFKAPNDFGFALKHPRVQIKDECKHITYLCAESEGSLLKWLTGLRIIKNKDFLLDNYQNQLAEMTTGHCIARENRVVIAINKEESSPSSRVSRNNVPPPRMHAQQILQHHHHPSQDVVYSPSSTTSSSNSSDRDLALQIPHPDLLHVSKQSCESLSSSGCVSETSSSMSENGGFELDYHNGGTIKRKPTTGRVMPPPPVAPRIVKESPGGTFVVNDPPTPLAGSDDDDEDFVLPPPPMPDLSIVGRFGEDTIDRSMVRVGSNPTTSSTVLPLPPPPHSMEPDPSNIYQVNAMYNHQYSGCQVYATRQTHPQPMLAQSHHQHYLLQNEGTYHQNNVNVNNGNLGYPSPPPTEEEENTLYNGGSAGAGAIREELYPCGVIRCLFPNRSGNGGVNINPGNLKKTKWISSKDFQIKFLRLPPQQIQTTWHLAWPRKKRITFNELVQNFDMETSESIMTPLKDNDPGFKVPSASVRNPNPGKLFGEDHGIKGTPPREFLNDLQRVMYRKWAVAQKISFPGDRNGQEDEFNRVGLLENGIGPGFSNYNENAVSHWILQSLKHCQINDNVEEVILPEEELPPPPPSLLLPPQTQSGMFPQRDPTKKSPVFHPFHHNRTVPNTFPPRPEDRPFLLAQMRASGQILPPQTQQPSVESGGAVYYRTNDRNNGEYVIGSGSKMLQQPYQ
nr:LOW QUALITY PROTEIN: abnormal cell migration protein 10-like [Lepeophtheirus salmonis]